MAGSWNDVLYGVNLDFTGNHPPTGQMTQNGQLLIGAASPPFIRAALIASGNGIAPTVGPGSLTLNMISPFTGDFLFDGTLRSDQLTVGSGYTALAAPTNGAIIEGSVGIGTSSIDFANSQLEIKDSSTVQQVLFSTTASTLSRTWHANGSSSYAIGISTNNRFVIWNNINSASPLINMTSTGLLALGLGDTSPALNRLDVSGAIAIGSSYAGVNTAPTNGAIIQGATGIQVTAPTAALHIGQNSSCFLADAATTVSITAGFRGQFGNPSVGGTGGFIFYKNSSTVDDAVWRSHHSNSGQYVEHRIVDGTTSKLISIASFAGFGIQVPISRLHQYENTSAVDATCGVTIEQDGAGDAVCQFLLTGIQRWVIGIDNSDSDSFKLSPFADLNNYVMRVATTGAVNLLPSSANTALNIAGTLVGQTGIFPTGVTLEPSISITSGANSASTLLVSPQPTSGAGSMTNFYGVYIQAGAVNTVPTTGYSLYVEEPDYGTNKFAAFFEGKVGINESNANTNFQITDPSTASLHLRDSGASTNQQVMRLQTNSNLTTFQSRNDAGSSSIVDSILSMNHTSGHVCVGTTASTGTFRVFDSSSETDIQVGILIDQGSTGDADLHWRIATGDFGFSAGIDNSTTNNDWVLCAGYSLGTANIISIDGVSNDVTFTNNVIGGGDIRATLDFEVLTAGNTLRIAEGSNAKMGTATLVAGSATVSTTAVTANSRIFLTSNVDGGTPGFIRVSARTAGNNFVITSSSGTDTSTIAWVIFEPT